MLAGGKNSRLYKRLVYDMQIAQDVSAFQASAALSSSFQIIATPRPGQPSTELQKVIDEEIAKLQQRAADRARARAVAEPDRSVVLQPHGAGRRLRRQGRSAERATSPRPAIPTGSTRISAAIARCRRPTSAPPPRSFCRSTGASS